MVTFIFHVDGKVDLHQSMKKAFGAENDSAFLYIVAELLPLPHCEETLPLPTLLGKQMCGIGIWIPADSWRAACPVPGAELWEYHPAYSPSGHSL